MRCAKREIAMDLIFMNINFPFKLKWIEIEKEKR